MNQTIHPGTSIGQIEVRVSDLQRSIAFYRDIVGLQVLKEQHDRVEMTVDGANSLLILREIQGTVIRPRRPGAGLYHFAILLPTRTALGRSLRHLMQNGIQVNPADHTVSEALYISDPDHNGIEIYSDRPRSAWPRNEQGEYVMGVEPLDINSLLAEAGNEAWQGLPSGTTMGHIHLHVSDLEAAKQFYHHLLGFEITSNYKKTALFLSAGGYHHHIAANIWAGIGAPLTPVNAPGLSYYEIKFDDGTARNEVIERLSAAGIKTERQQNSVIVYDPAGIEIHLVL